MAAAATGMVAARSLSWLNADTAGLSGQDVWRGEFEG